MAHFNPRYQDILDIKISKISFLSFRYPSEMHLKGRDERKEGGNHSLSKGWARSVEFFVDTFDTFLPSYLSFPNLMDALIIQVQYHGQYLFQNLQQQHVHDLHAINVQQKRRMLEQNATLIANYVG